MNIKTCFSHWETKKLKKEAKILYELIYGTNDCFNEKDIFYYQAILTELSKRGVEPKTELNF